MIKLPKFTEVIYSILFFAICFGGVIAYSYFWVNNFNKYIKIDNNVYITAKSTELQDYPKPRVIKVNIMPEREIKYSFKLNRISAYTNSIRETDSTPNNTSCGHINDVKKKYIIAVSRDIFFRYGYKWLCGKHATIVYSDGTRIEGVIYDTMNARYRNTADILIRKSNLTIARKAAFKHGAQTGKVLIY